MIFTLPNSNVKGHQLADEIRIATGIDVVDRYARIGDTLDFVINGEDIEANATAIQAVIDAHVPNPLYFPEDVKQANINDVLDRLNMSALADMTPAEIYTAMQNIIDGWGKLADAKADLAEWLPLMAAVIFWKVK